MMNLTVMKLDLALKVPCPSKPTDKSSNAQKKLFEEWEYSNQCCIMIMRYHMEDSIHDSISNV